MRCGIQIKGGRIVRVEKEVGRGDERGEIKSER